MYVLVFNEIFSTGKPYDEEKDLCKRNAAKRRQLELLEKEKNFNNKQDKTEDGKYFLLKFVY